MNTHGGANRGQGRKPKQLKKYIATIRCTPAEWEKIKLLTPEQRAQALVYCNLDNPGVQ